MLDDEPEEADDLERERFLDWVDEVMLAKGETKEDKARRDGGKMVVAEGRREASVVDAGEEEEEARERATRRRDMINPTQTDSPRRSTRGGWV